MTMTIEPARFRQILGHYPTGVCAITAMGDGGKPVAMVVGTFTSVSLDPPLVAFFPGKNSTSWPQIEATGRFCVNVLAKDQGAICRVLSSKAEDKFAGIPYRLSEHGTPILEGVVAWIACDLQAVHEAGDHYIALGHVRALEIENPHSPMIFHCGGYGQVAALEAV